LTKTSKTIAVILPLAILAGGFYFANKQSTSDPSQSTDVSTLQDQSGSIEPTQKPHNSIHNPLATKTVEHSASSTTEPNGDLALQTNNQSANQTASVSTPEPSPVLTDNTQSSDDLAQKADRYNDSEFRRMEARLSSDAALRMQLLEEFRNYPGSDRAKQIAALLGPFDDPEIIETASMLVYSGDPDSQKMGLELLSRMQPHNDEARNIAIDLLSSVDDPATLVSTMNVLAIPTDDANAEQRQLLADNTNSLSNHRDPRVRSHSLSIMSRWQQNSATTVAAIEKGLTDPEAAVRASAVYGSNNMTSPSEALIDNLLSIAENTDEKRTVRSAAARALGKMTLSPTQMRRFRIARARINRRDQ